MKSITRLSLALMMFSLFSISYFVTSVSADMDNPPADPSNDPRNIMKSESVDLNKQTLQLHKRIEELENQLNEERAKSDKFSADLNIAASMQKRIEDLENQLNEQRAKRDKFSADLNKQTAQTQKRIEELENQLNEERAIAVTQHSAFTANVKVALEQELTYQVNIANMQNAISDLRAQLATTAQQSKLVEELQASMEEFRKVKLAIAYVCKMQRQRAAAFTKRIGFKLNKELLESLRPCDGY
jgi:peptidoglycan hydrolase CwlO-like protein